MAKYRHESDEEPKFIRELRKTVRKLVSENRQLRKENRMLKQVDQQKDFTPEILEPEIPEPAAKYEVRYECPSCGVYIKNVFQIRDMLYYRCECCSSKGKIPHENS